MWNPVSKTNVARHSHNLLLAAVTFLAVNQNLALYAGPPRADPRPSNPPKQVEQDKSKKDSDSGVLSDIRKAINKQIKALLTHLRPGTPEYRP